MGAGAGPEVEPEAGQRGVVIMASLTHGRGAIASSPTAELRRGAIERAQKRRSARNAVQNASDEFLRAIPKADLHVHLDGSLRVSTIIQLAHKNGVALSSYDEAELREKVFKKNYASLEEYLKEPKPKRRRFFLRNAPEGASIQA